MDAQAEQATVEEDIIRVYGIKMRQQTDFTSNIVKVGIFEKTYLLNFKKRNSSKKCPPKLISRIF